MFATESEAMAAREFASVAAILCDDGSVGTVHTAMVRLRVGRLIVRMPIIAYGGEPYGEADVAAIVRPVVRKVASADS